jgi:Ca2+-binding RTX toxin-like protein
MDTLTAVEHLITGSGNDSLAGNSFGNILNGAQGADTPLGVSGADTLIGGAGADLLIGRTAETGSNSRPARRTNCPLPASPTARPTSPRRSR